MEEQNFFDDIVAITNENYKNYKNNDISENVFENITEEAKDGEFYSSFRCSEISRRDPILLRTKGFEVTKDITNNDFIIVSWFNKTPKFSKTEKDVNKIPEIKTSSFYDEIVNVTNNDHNLPKYILSSIRQAAAERKRNIRVSVLEPYAEVLRKQGFGISEKKESYGAISYTVTW